jgi:hypothetical protein
MWIYRDKEIHYHEDLHSDCVEIVYEITYKSGKKYIGKKSVRAMRKLPPTKKQLAIRKNFKRVEKKDIPFVKYEGSSEETKDQVVAKKEIFYQCSNKRTSTYVELGLIISCDALVSDEYLNKNALGKFFDNCLDGLIE